MADIKVEALRHVYSEGTPFERVAIEDISVEIPAGQFVGIIGHTGSGKSTFIQHLNGLLQPSAGTVTLGGQNIFETKKITHNIRFRVGLVFQYPEYQLFEETVYKDISFGPKNMGLDEKEIDAHVRRAAAFTGISENLFEDSPLELSGGQKRRVAINWDWVRQQIRDAGTSVRVLNLFAYTGAATVACAAEGASVCHVDAAKGMVSWAKENAVSSGLSEAPIRWIVDDCGKFLRREIRRGHRYNALILDPPSYGRGPGGEIWKLETNLWPFLTLCAEVLENPVFVLLNSYTTGLAPSVLHYMMEELISSRFGGHSESQELGLPVTRSGLTLPCGASCRWTR